MEKKGFWKEQPQDNLYVVLIRSLRLWHKVDGVHGILLGIFGVISDSY